MFQKRIEILTMCILFIGKKCLISKFLQDFQNRSAVQFDIIAKPYIAASSYLLFHLIR